MNLLKDLCYVVLLVGIVAAAVPLVADWSGAVNMRRAGLLFIACAVALCLWMVLLGMTLPAEVNVRHWPAAWIGLDAMEACCLAATGILILKRDIRVCAAAGAAAALLTMDAWFDITTAQRGSAYLIAMILGFGIELPLAAVCALIAWNAPHRFTLAPSGRDQGSGDLITHAGGDRR
jgi:hypothetical protein